MPEWRSWINDEEEYTRFQKHGYYSYKLNITNDKLVKVISINTFSCDEHNKYIMGVLSDPND